MKKSPLVLLSIILVIIFIELWDIGCNNSYLTNRLVYGSDCNYQVPEGYSIYYSSERNRYAVKVNEFGDYYLYNGRVGITGMFSSIAEPALFKDSCEAKAFLKDYIIDKQIKFK